ncbi:hypothetical protein VNI00_015355 [Paramarasmius palmivorus]|uniref:GmrSD restriction endonucleases N-terminal domain-containing protein n=1 Tax=Paramarasmius palmivorus TaxID=297713 RepID=A0AAW0BPK3_9AGAR
MEPEAELSPLTDDEYLDASFVLPTTSHPRPKDRPRMSQARDYTLQNALQPPRATTYTAQALFEQIMNEAIDLNPEYQRDVVWSTQKQIQLIDSIFRNYYIPPIIFAVVVHSDGSESRTCIDGKQRLTSIRLFMDGLIPHKDYHTSQQLWFKDNRRANSAKSAAKVLLPDKYCQIFANKQIVCVEYGELKESDERDIFRRVQLGIALTASEKLQAISTPRADFIRHLLAKYTTETTLGHADVCWDRERARDFQVFSTAVCLLAKWSMKTGLDTWPTVPQVEVWMKERTLKSGGGKKRKKEEQPDNVEYVQVSELFVERMDKAFDFLSKLQQAIPFNVGHLSQGLPARNGRVYYAYIFTATDAGASSKRRIFYSHIPKDLERLSRLIMKMRTQLREAHTDIRMNITVARTMFDFILEAGRNPFIYEGSLSDSEPEFESEEDQPKRSKEAKKISKRNRLAGSSASARAVSRKPRVSVVLSKSKAKGRPRASTRRVVVTPPPATPSVARGREREDSPTISMPPPPPSSSDGQMDVISQQMAYNLMLNMMVNPSAYGMFMGMGMNPSLMTQWIGGGSSSSDTPQPSIGNGNMERFASIPADVGSSDSAAKESDH